MRACNEKSEASKHNQVHSASWDSKYQRCCGDHDDGGCYHGDEQEHYTLVSGRHQPSSKQRVEEVSHNLTDQKDESIMFRAYNIM